MLYLLKDPGLTRKMDKYKIGFSNNIDLRLSNYISLGPNTIIISVRSGTEIEETKLHLYLYCLGLKSNTGREWYINSPEVLKYFHQDFRKIDRYLWRNRKRILGIQNTVSKSIGKIIKQIFQDLQKKYKSNDENIITKTLSLSYFKDKMEKIIEYIKNHPEDLSKVPERYRRYFDELSLNDLENGSTRKDLLEKKIKIQKKNKTKEASDIIKKVYENFTEGEVYMNSEIRNILNNIYQPYYLSSKATDIKRYFETSRAQITNKLTGKREEGFRLLKKKY